MARRTYGQLCGLARALDAVGDRWTLLIVRDLAVRPRRFSDLQQALPGIGTGLLSDRLRHLETLGVATRVARSRPEGGVTYELTARGQELWGALLPLARWGVELLAAADDDEDATFDPDWLIVMLRALFRHERATGLTECYEFRVAGETVWAVVDDGALDVGKGPAPRPPDFVLTTDVATLAGLGSRRVDMGDAMATGRVEFEGDPEAGRRALELFSVGSPVAMIE